MADVLTKRQRSRLMSRIRSSGTRPERALRALVRELTGARIRCNWRGLPGSPDVVVPGLRLAIMVQGCFWHRCPVHGRTPKSNVLFWERKLSRNVRRDRLNRSRLRGLGWTVWWVWEHDLAPGRLPAFRKNLRRRLSRHSGRG